MLCNKKYTQQARVFENLGEEGHIEPYKDKQKLPVR